MLHSRAAELFATARDKYAGKPLENNTRLVKLENGDYAIRLHWTNVVVIHADGTYTINSGGYETATTKDRINGYSPARVFQKDFCWYVANPDYNRFVNYHDGIRVDAQGKVIA